MGPVELQRLSLEELRELDRDRSDAALKILLDNLYRFRNKKEEEKTFDRIAAILRKRLSLYIKTRFRNLVPSEHDIEEVVTDTLASLWTRLCRGWDQPSITNLFAYAAKIAQSEIVARERNARPIGKEELQLTIDKKLEDQGYRSEIEDAFIAQEHGFLTKAKLRSTIASLSAQHQLILLLGLKQEDLAEISHCACPICYLADVLDSASISKSRMHVWLMKDKTTDDSLSLPPTWYEIYHAKYGPFCATELWKHLPLADKEIAFLLDTSRGTVHVTRHRIVEKLRKALDEIE